MNSWDKMTTNEIDQLLELMYGGAVGAHFTAASDKAICAHSAQEGAGTKKTGYALPEMGPFKCANCVHANEDATRCDHKEVIADEDVPKEDGLAVIKPKSCCNYFHPEDEDDEEEG